MNVTQRPAAELYLDLLKGCLTRSVVGGEDYVPAVPPRGTVKHRLFEPVRKWLAGKNMEVIRHVPFNLEVRAEGRDWPAQAETMIGLRRLDNLQQCVTDVIRQGVPGDLIETGVWRGGATILMRAVLEAYGDTERTVWVADSFEGLPKPDAERYPADQADQHWMQGRLAVSVDEVKANFARYGLLDDRVRFLVGWFEDTLPSAPIERLAVLRLDGDMYSSTMQALESLYPRLSPRGYVIVDDYGAIHACKEAITDFRASHGIIEPMESVDWTGVWWRKAS
jgi:O-methyltransferase